MTPRPVEEIEADRFFIETEIESLQNKLTELEEEQCEREDGTACLECCEAGYVDCSVCDGTGEEQADGEECCFECEGEGTVTCPECNGDGRVDW